MADDTQDGFDPGEHKAPEVVEHLADAPEAEKVAVGAAELQADKPRKTVLEAAGLDPNKRYDASGRELMPWESTPKKADAEV